MAIYAVQGLCAAGCLFTTYRLLEHGLNLPFFSKPEGVFNETIKKFVDSQAKKMGLEKEVVVVSTLKQGSEWDYSSYGNTWLPGKVTIEVNYELEDYEITLDKFEIARQIAHIKANDHLIIPVAILAASLFTTFVLTVNRDLFTRYVGGLGTALMTYVILMRRAERRADLEAIKHCSKKVNQKCLDTLLEVKEKKQDFYSWILESSFDEKIGYFQAHLDLQKEDL